MPDRNISRRRSPQTSHRMTGEGARSHSRLGRSWVGAYSTARSPVSSSSPSHWNQRNGLLLETGLLAVLYAPTQLRPSLECERAPSPVMRWLVWGLLLRLMFLSGITKLASGDPTWLHFTALDYHFWTQPLPTWDRRSRA